jgi:hypothetical protein
MLRAPTAKPVEDLLPCNASTLLDSGKTSINLLELPFFIALFHGRLTGLARHTKRKVAGWGQTPLDRIADG